MLVNIYLWKFQPDVHWMWWNLIGFVATLGVARGLALFTPGPSGEQIEQYTLTGAGMWQEERKWVKTYAILIGYFVLIVVVGLMFNNIASGG